MRKIFFILGSTFIFFLLELLIFNFFSQRFTPHLMLLLIVFFYLSWGPRHSLFCALWAGFLKDCFSVTAVGSYTVIFIWIAFLAPVIGKYIYRKGSVFLRILLVFILLGVEFILQCLWQAVSGHLEFSVAVKYIFLPETIITLLVTTKMFQYLRKCVLKLSV